MISVEDSVKGIHSILAKVRLMGFVEGQCTVKTIEGLEFCYPTTGSVLMG